MSCPKAAMPLCLDPKGLIRDREVRVGMECRAGRYSLSDIQLWFQGRDDPAPCRALSGT